VGNGAVRPRERAGSMKLKNAPLVEVVFTLQWVLVGGVDMPPPFRSDPAYPVLEPVFQKRIGRAGFGHVQQNPQAATAAVPLGHMPRLQFSPDSGDRFPMIQIGPGVLACNQSSAYEWRPYVKIVLTAIKALLAAYPHRQFGLRPQYVELAYVDAFGDRFSDSQDLVQFMAKNSTLALEVPPSLRARLGDPLVGGVNFSAPLKSEPRSTFALQLSSGSHNNARAIVLNTKVSRNLNDAWDRKVKEALPQRVARWLDTAHTVLSPTFVDLMKPEFAKKFDLDRGVA